MKLRRGRLATVLLAGAFAAAVSVAALGRAGAIPAPGIAALESGSSPASDVPPEAANLAEAVAEWNGENGRTGEPITNRTMTLLSGVGSQRDSLGAFPTTTGLVCFEIRAAGTCNKLEDTGIAWAILSAHGSRRVFGVAADRVSRVDIDVNGTREQVLLRSNGFYYELPADVREVDLKSLVVTWDDGSTHDVPLPGAQQNPSP